MKNYETTRRFRRMILNVMENVPIKKIYGYDTASVSEFVYYGRSYDETEYGFFEAIMSYVPEKLKDNKIVLVVGVDLFYIWLYDNTVTIGLTLNKR